MPAGSTPDFYRAAGAAGLRTAAVRCRHSWRQLGEREPARLRHQAAGSTTGWRGSGTRWCRSITGCRRSTNGRRSATTFLPPSDSCGTTRLPWELTRTVLCCSGGRPVQMATAAAYAEVIPGVRGIVDIYGPTDFDLTWDAATRAAESRSPLQPRNIPRRQPGDSPRRIPECQRRHAGDSAAPDRP